MDAVLLSLLILAGVYFLPVIIAWARKSRRAVVITVLTIVLGWTVIGWVILLILALVTSRQKTAMSVNGAEPITVQAAAAATPAGQAVSSEELAHLNYARQFLLESYRRQFLDHDTCARLLTELNAIQASRSALAPAAAVTAAAVGTWATPIGSIAQTISPASVVAETRESPPPTAITAPEAVVQAREPVVLAPAAPRGPSMVDRLWQIVRSDVALHGLAYLGVLLTFTGTLGFVLFAFNTVSVPLRATAGIAIPTILFLTAWFLYRRGSVLVAHSLETLAAAVTPVALFADLSLIVRGWLLTTLEIAVALLLMVAYWFFWRRRPASPLRFLVAGMFWAAAWACGFYLQAGYSATQVALTSAAIGVSLAIGVARPGHPLASATRVAAIPAMLAVYVLVILFAIAGAAVLPLFVAGLAMVITVELLAMQSSRHLEVSVIQPLLLASLALAIGRLIDIGLAGTMVTIAFLALLEWQEWRRPHLVGFGLASTGVIAGLSLALIDPWASVIAWGIVSVWIHVRRLRPTLSLAAASRRWSIPAIGLATALPLGLAIGLLRALPLGVALLTISLIALGLTIIVRVFLRRDPFYAYWLPATAAAVVLGAIVAPGSLDYARITAVLALGIALAFAPRWPVVRVWTAAAPLIWVVLGVFDLLHLPFDERIAALSMAGLVVVAIAELRPSAIAGHLAAIGFIVELSALGASNPGWTRVLALAALAIALGLVAVLQELQGSSFVALLARAVRPIRLTPVAAALPAVGLVITMPFLVVDLGGQLGVLTGRRSLAGLALAMTALGYAAAARLLRKRQPIAAIAATSAVLLSGVGIAVAAPDLWPVIIAVAVSIAIVLVIGGDLRRSFMTWFAWLMSIVLVILVADAVSVPAGSLHLVLLGVGAGYVVGGLLYDDVASGRRLVGEGLRQSWLMPPVALGSLAVPAALAFTFPHGASSFGWWSIAAALFYLVVAVQLRSGAVSSASYALAAFGLSVVSPWHLLDRPWLLLPVAAILVALSAAIRRLHPGARDLTSRWDLAPLLVAHIVGGVALARAVGLDSVAPTWSAFGGLCLVVAAWRRHWAWAATGLVLLLVGAQAAGPGWLALALIVTAGVTAVIAQRSAGVLRIAMQAGTMIAGGSAWLSALVWRSASVDAAVATTAMAFGATWLLVALLGRRRLKPDWLTAAGALATIGVAAASATGITLGQQRHPFALLVAGGFALHAAGTALAARPLRWSFLRELAMLILTVAVGSAIFDLQPSLTISGAFLAVLSAVAFGGALVLSRLRMPSDWLRPLLLFGGLMSAGAMGYGVSALPLRGLLIATLLLLAVEAASVSLILRRTEPMYLVPVFACGAWLAFATDALAGNPDWLTVPIGLTALAIVELFRRDRRAARIAINSPELIVLEYAGMLFVVGASLVQTVSQSVLYGLLAMALGIGLAAWGFMTRVKRRIEVGAGAVAIAAVLMVSVPVVRIIPQFQGAALWAALAAIGIVLLLVATMLEQGRSAVRRTYRRFEELMLGWE